MASLKNLQDVNFAELDQLKSDPTILIIDVREKSEIQETGSIPGAINIPLKDLENVLGTETDAETFKKIYCRQKPTNDFPIIFTCRSGRRSAMAQEKAINLGYTKVLNYSGGWLDWENQTKQ